MSYIGKGVEVVTFNTATTLDVAGNITVGGTVDGRDVATDGTKLDTITSGAIADILQDTTPQLGGNLDLNTSNVIGTGNINVTGSITGTSFVSTGDMSFTNNSKAIFGTSPSLEIYHDGSNSILDDVGAGNFKMQLAGADKLEVTSSGVDITGTVTADGLNLDDADVIAWGSGSSRPAIIGNNTTDDLDFYVNGAKALNISSGNDISFYEDTGTTAKFFWDASTQRLGLGNTAPQSRLDIAGAGGGSGVAFKTTDASLNETFYIQDGGRVGVRYTPFTVGIPRTTSPATSAIFQVEEAGYLTVLNSGNVGIGTISPSTKLQVKDGTNINVLIGSLGSTAAVYANNDAGSAYQALRIDGSSLLLNSYSGGNVGIGTSSPTAKLHVFGDVGDGLRLDRNNTGAVGNQIAFRHSNAGTLTETASINAISTANADTGTLAFYTKASGGSNTERMRIDSSGNLLVGKIASNVANVGFEAKSDGAHFMTRDSGEPLKINRKTSDGNLIAFAKDGSTVGSIAVSSGDNLQILGAATDHAGFEFGTNLVIPKSNGATADGAIDLGFSSGRFSNLYLSGGVYLGGTGSANHLDDYEEGEWNPVVNAPGITLTGGDQKGWYTKIGNMVFFKASIYHTGGSGTSTGNLSISGLPFTSAAYDGDNIASGAMGTNDSAWGAITPTHWRIGWASTTISLHTKDSSDARDSSQSEVDASNYVGYATMRFTGMYWV